MDLYYEIHGHGRPVVLLHSGGADSRDWKFVIPFLAKQFKVIVFDGRGAGKSPSPITPANYVEDLLHLLDDLTIEKAILVGHSIGGQVATDFSLKYPERVSELVLIAPSLSGFRYSPEFHDWMRKIEEAAPDMDKMIALALAAPSYRIVMSGPHKGLMVDMLRHHFIKVAEWGTYESIWPEPPSAERLEEVTTKTLFIIGDEELPDNRRVAECFRKVPHIRFTRIAGADHMVTLTHPEDLCRHITSFLEE